MVRALAEDLMAASVGWVSAALPIASRLGARGMSEHKAGASSHPTAFAHFFSTSLLGTIDSAILDGSL